MQEEAAPVSTPACADELSLLAEPARRQRSGLAVCSTGRLLNLTFCVSPLDGARPVPAASTTPPGAELATERWGVTEMASMGSGQLDSSRCWSLKWLSSSMTVATSMFRSRGLDLRAFQTPASCRAGSFHPALTARVQKSTAYSARSLVDHKQLVVPEWFGWSNTTLKLSSSSSYIRFPRSVQALINWSQVSALPLSRPIKKFT